VDTIALIQLQEQQDLPRFDALLSALMPLLLASISLLSLLALYERLTTFLLVPLVFSMAAAAAD